MHAGSPLLSAKRQAPKEYFVSLALCLVGCYGLGGAPDGNQEDVDGEVAVDDGAADEAPACDAAAAPAVPLPLAPANGTVTGSLWAGDGFSPLRPRFRWRSPDDGCADVTFTRTRLACGT